MSSVPRGVNRNGGRSPSRNRFEGGRKSDRLQTTTAGGRNADDSWDRCSRCAASSTCTPWAGSRGAPAQRQPRRLRAPARLSVECARDDCRSDRRASRPAGLALWPDRVHCVVPRRGRSRRHDRRDSPGCRRLHPGPPNLSTQFFQHPGARLRHCDCGRQGRRLRPGSARCRLPDPCRPAAWNGRRRIRSARRAFPPARERRSRRRRVARATAGDSARDHPWCNR